MVNERFTVLLSPPNSPRMSDATAKADDYYSQYAPHSAQYLPRGSIQHGQAGVHDDNREHPYDQARHSLRSYKSSPYALGPSTQLGYQGNHNDPHHGYQDRMIPQGPQPVRAADSEQTTGAVSTASSPTDRLTPRSESAHAKDPHDDDDVIDIGGEDPDEEGEKVPMTAAELRAAKRKMKRFRLTHNQTRFLMSEFARQAHPDAAHRERLAREIPGLSARQVQVWFQNRRAKLKRLTTDDRERMMRSRALPEHFDTTQALHSPFGAQPPPMGAPVPGMGGYSHYGDNGGIRPLTLDTLRRVPDYDQYGQQYASMSGVSPALGAFAFTPPQSASEHLSPTSATSGMSPFVLQQQGTYEPAKRPPIGLPGATQATYMPHQQAPRLPLHDRFARTLSEAAGSPLRTSVSYSTLGSISQPVQQYPERAASYSEHSTYGHQRPYLQRNPSNTSVTEPSSYGLGFSYTHTPSYQQSEQQQRPPPASGVQHSAETEPYRRPAPPSSNYSQQYEHSSFNASQVPQYQGYTAQYPSQNLPGGYQVTEPPRPQGQEQGHHQAHENYPAVPGAQQPYIHQQVADSQSSAHGMSMPPSY
ncbi:hypothetical protein M409DRAFT_53856 [Zasmidium cellare ATCC 36951]|uniref:Homeobox domain-containing protein n=1 Tax=Zasmidium cellare ATCC 36951 TaxID=1080233 RepID=A0A6A6CKX9_ZASCE|nr:uncharacterized protein M409DRAFT_53856 [Zasmidium cellare ATCC 36951]KAF2167907.1 hypothetical protein M409DRAFT_53856 [Zasmidium cellare ATCC 36951]